MPVSIFSVTWDFRSFWTILPLAARLYLFVLFCLLLYALPRLIHLAMQPKEDGTHEATDRYQGTVFRISQCFQLMLLIFGVIESDLLFSGARALELQMQAYARRVDLDVLPAFDGPTGFAVIVLLAHSVLFCLMWFTRERVRAVSLIR